MRTFRIAAAILIATAFLAAGTAEARPPLGEKIVFATDRDGNWEIYSMNPDGTDQKRLTNHPIRDDEPVL